MAEPLLQTRDLSMHFGGVKAVRNVNFTLAEGELRCLIGPNGAGKSTFFKMLTGQLQPSLGQVLFRGHDISQAHAHEIARLGIGIKTQVPSVFDGLSVRENIWLAASRIHGRDRVNAVVDEMLERIGLTAAATGWSANSPMVNGNGSNWASCCRPIPNSSCSTNPPPA